MTTAPVLATAVALRLDRPAVLQAGSALVLEINPDAGARAATVTGSDPTSTAALAIGLGAGYSAYYALQQQARQLLSPELRIRSGSGLLTGIASADAIATGAGPLNASATAWQTGLAGIDWLSNYAGNIDAGRADAPLEARARAGTTTQLPPPPGAAPQPSILNADARVRGIEASTILGQPNAVVRASSTLDLTNVTSQRSGTASADAIALDALIAQGTTPGNGNDTRIGGVARSALTLELGPQAGAAPLGPLQLRGPAIGINSSTLTAGPSLNTTFRGEGLATIALDARDALGNPELDPAAAAAAIAAARAASSVSDLRGIGINRTTIRSGAGDTTVIARGGVFDNGVPYSGNNPAADLLAAGLNESTVLTSGGDDFIFGKVLTESDVELDVNGDGLFSADQYLVHDNDTSADTTTPGRLADRFNGIRNSTVLTGGGNDAVAGAASGSWIFTQAGDNAITLDLARDSSLWGGFQTDTISVGQESHRVVAWGNLGEDTITGAASGSGNTFDGGLHADLISGTTGASDDFLFTDANAALTAASTVQVNRLLTDSNYWRQLSQQQKDDIFLTGQVLTLGGSLAGAVDVIGSDGTTLRPFETGANGDRLVLNSSIASITQDLWNRYGAIYQVDDTGRVSLLDSGGATPQPSKGIAVVVGTLDNIRRLGSGVSSLAYATDTRQLMFDADTNWQSGDSVSLGTINTTGSFTKDNFRFGSLTAAAMGAPTTAPLRP